MENAMVKVGSHQMQMKIFNDRPVVTFKDIDTVHERPDGTASRNFRKNRQHFIENEDFFKITPDEFRRTIGKMDARQQNEVTLLSETGYLMLVKSFTDNLAWDIQRSLVNNYFKHKTEVSNASNMVSMDYVNQQINNAVKTYVEPLRNDFNHNMNMIHNAFVGVQKALPATQATATNTTVSQTVSFGDEEWKAKQFVAMKSLIKERPEYKKVNVVLRKVYAKMRNVYGIVFEQEHKDYCERHNTSGHISTIEVVSDKEMLRSLFSSILADMFHPNTITPEHRQAMTNTVIDPVRETIKPLIEKRHDISKGGNNTFRKVYSAMDVSWNIRKSRYRNAHNLKNYPSKMTVVKSNPKLLKMFCDTVNQMLAE